MNNFKEKLFDQIKQWNTRRDELDDKIDFIYELIDREEVENKKELLNEIKVLDTEREEIEDLIDLAYKQVDKYFYNKAM